MKTYSIPFLILFFWSSSILAQAQMSVYWADTLNKTLEKEFNDEGMNGLVGSVVFSDGSVWVGGEGNHFNLPLGGNFLYDIGSNTKTLIAAIVLLLEEEGKLSISDSLYSYISPVTNVMPGVTIEQLLKHRSGVYNYTEHPNYINEILNDETKFWHPDTILKDFVLAPTGNPNQQFRYSNTGYILLGKLIEAVENKALNDVLRDRIYQPLGLNNMFLAQYDMYTSTKTGAWLSPLQYYPSIESLLGSAWAAGGVVSQPEDFARFAHKMLRGDLLSNASMQKLRIGTQLQGGDIYGLGVIESDYMGHTYLGHGGTTLQNSEMEYSLSSDFSLVLFNLDNGYFDETRRARNAFLELLEYIESNHQGMVTVEERILDFPVSIYPNPSSNLIKVKLESLDNLDEAFLRVKDITGRVLSRQTFNSEILELQKSDYGNGVFVLEVLRNEAVLRTERIIFN